MSLVKWIDIPRLGDDRGQLNVIEAKKNIPFEIKRIYYLTATRPDIARGFHAHKKLQQLAICVSGKCKMILDNGTKREEVWLNTPSKGLLIDDLVWHEMHNFSPDCVLLVLADHYYDEADYIRDYSDFLKEIHKCN